VYDLFNFKLKLVVTGSSSLNIYLRETGLDRTKLISLQTLYYEEYLKLSKSKSSLKSFETFLGNFGFPKYTQMRDNNFTLLKSEIYDEIVTNDIPREFKINSASLIRLINRLAHLSNGEVNLRRLSERINIDKRTALSYIDILEKCSLLKIIKKIKPNGHFLKNDIFKVYLNPHIHL
jgi:predicted AAA+ superfamily ATPase